MFTRSSRSASFGWLWIASFLAQIAPNKWLTGWAQWGPEVVRAGLARRITIPHVACGDHCCRTPTQNATWVQQFCRLPCADGLGLELLSKKVPVRGSFGDKVFSDQPSAGKLPMLLEGATIVNWMPNARYIAGDGNMPYSVHYTDLQLPIARVIYLSSEEMEGKMSFVFVLSSL